MALKHPEADGPLPVAAVVHPGIHAIQRAHARGKVGIRRLHEQVRVVVYQAPSVTEPVDLAHDTFQGLEKGQRIFAVFDNVLDPCATHGAVIQGVGELDADGARHGGSRLA